MERELLIVEVAGVDDAGEAQAVCVRVQVRGAAQFVFHRLRSLKCGDGGSGRSDDARGLIDHHAL